MDNGDDVDGADRDDDWMVCRGLKDDWRQNGDVTRSCRERNMNRTSGGRRGEVAAIPDKRRDEASEAQEVRRLRRQRWRRPLPKTWATSTKIRE